MRWPIEATEWLRITQPSRLHIPAHLRTTATKVLASVMSLDG